MVLRDAELPYLCTNRGVPSFQGWLFASLLIDRLPKPWRSRDPCCFFLLLFAPKTLFEQTTLL